MTSENLNAFSLSGIDEFFKVRNEHEMKNYIFVNRYCLEWWGL